MQNMQQSLTAKYGQIYYFQKFHYHQNTFIYNIIINPSLLVH